jgi:hypothetical protein
MGLVLNHLVPTLFLRMTCKPFCVVVVVVVHLFTCISHLNQPCQYQSSNVCQSSFTSCIGCIALAAENHILVNLLLNENSASVWFQEYDSCFLQSIHNF